MMKLKLLALLIAALAAPTLSARTLASPNESTANTQEAANASEFTETAFSFQVDLAMMLDSVESDTPGRRVDADPFSAYMGSRARLASQHSRHAGYFIETGLGFNLGALSAYFEDDRPNERNHRDEGGVFAANVEFGVGGYLGPVSFSAGLMARALSAYLPEKPDEYEDRDNDGNYEHSSYTFGWGYWATYVEATLLFRETVAGPPNGSLAGSGVIVRYMPTVGFDFRDGEDKTWGWSARAQFVLDLGGQSGGVFVEAGAIADDSEGSDDIWWVKLGVSAYFD